MVHMLPMTGGLWAFCVHLGAATCAWSPPVGHTEHASSYYQLHHVNLQYIYLHLFTVPTPNPVTFDPPLLYHIF